MTRRELVPGEKPLYWTMKRVGRQNGRKLVAASSGNVFADLGLREPAEKKTKVQLAVAINRLIARSRLTQASAASRMGINQPKISALSNYRLEGFSVARLMNLLNALGQDVDITIRRKPRARKTARIRVRAA